MTFPKVNSKIKFKKKKIKIKNLIDLNLKIKPHFIKIDVEGYDYFVLGDC
jgi:hypothetical protein